MSDSFDGLPDEAKHQMRPTPALAAAAFEVIAAVSRAHRLEWDMFDSSRHNYFRVVLSRGDHHVSVCIGWKVAREPDAIRMLLEGAAAELGEVN